MSDDWFTDQARRLRDLAELGFIDDIEGIEEGSVMDTLRALAQSRKVQIAAGTFFVSVLLYYVPNFPPEILEAAKQLALAVIAGIAIEDAAQKWNS